MVDKHNSMVVLLDRKRRISAATFMRAIGFSHEDVVEKLFRVVRKALTPGQVVARDIKSESGESWARAGEYVTEGLLDFLSSMGKVTGLPHWRKDADSAALLTGTVRNDHI